MVRVLRNGYCDVSEAGIISVVMPAKVGIQSAGERACRSQEAKPTYRLGKEAVNACFAGIAEQFS